VLTQVEVHIKWVGRYLYGTRDKGMIYQPNKKKSFEVYCDADFSGNWIKDLDQSDDPSSAKSRSGYFIQYHGCTLLWSSRLQGECALSSTESEILSLSAATREVIPLMNLLNEIKSKGLIDKAETPTVHCRVFEDNSGALEIARVPKIRARTKHINTKYFHFRSYVDKKQITIHPIRSEWQPADSLTKITPASLLQRHRKFMQGW